MAWSTEGERNYGDDFGFLGEPSESERATGNHGSRKKGSPGFTESMLALVDRIALWETADNTRRSAEALEQIAKARFDL